MRSILLLLILLYLSALDIAQHIRTSPSVSLPPSLMSPACSFCGSHPKSLTAHHTKCEVRLKEIHLGRQRNKEQRNLSRAASGARARSGGSGPNSIASSSTSNLVTVVEDPRALPVAEEGDTEMQIYEPPAPLIDAPMASGNRRILRSSRRQPPTVSDVLPETAMPLPRTIPVDNIPDSHDEPSAPAASAVSVLHRIRLVIRELFTTASNKFGITRVYLLGTVGSAPTRMPHH